MKVKVFSHSYFENLEESINNFIEKEILVVGIKYSTCEAFDYESNEMDITYSALIIYEQGICNE